MSLVLTSKELEERFGCTQLPQGVGGAGTSSPPVQFTGVAPLDGATSEQLSFLTNERYIKQALDSKAGGILCHPKLAQELADKVQGRLFACAEPYVVFARVAQHFYKPRHPFEGVSPQAHIDTSAKIHSTATVFPFAFVGPGAVVGARSVVYSGVFLGAGSRVGEDCILYPNSVVREGCLLGDRCVLNPGAVVGGDGFGFAPSGMENVRIPQTGAVQLGDDVDVGSNASIDRGAMADTRVGRHTKIDSLVQVGHNVVIGEACFLAAQAGIGGSTVIGKRVTIAGQVGVAGHLQVGDFVTLLAKSGVTKNLPAGREMYNGIPARTNREYLMQMATLSRLAKGKGKGSRDKE